MNLNEFCIYIAHFLCGIIKCALQHFMGDFKIIKERKRTIVLAINRPLGAKSLH